MAATFRAHHRPEPTSAMRDRESAPDPRIEDAGPILATREPTRRPTVGFRRVCQGQDGSAALMRQILRAQVGAGRELGSSRRLSAWSGLGAVASVGGTGGPADLASVFLDRE